MKIKVSRQIFEEYTDIKFNQTPTPGSRVVPCVRTDGLTDMVKLIAAFRNFGNAPKNETSRRAGIIFFTSNIVWIYLQSLRVHQVVVLYIAIISVYLDNDRRLYNPQWTLLAFPVRINYNGYMTAFNISNKRRIRIVTRNTLLE
jgi:hypothetical protein